MKNLSSCANRHRKNFKRKCWQTITMVIVTLFFIHDGNNISGAALAIKITESYPTTIVLDSNPKHHLQKKKLQAKNRSVRKKLRERLRSLKRDTFSTRDKILMLCFLLFICFLLELLVLAISRSLIPHGGGFLSWIVPIIIGAFLLIFLISWCIKMFREY